MNSVSDSIESIMEKGENAGYQHLLLSPQYFQKPHFFVVFESQYCVVKGYMLYSDLFSP